MKILGSVKGIQEAHSINGSSTTSMEGSGNPCHQMNARGTTPEVCSSALSSNTGGGGGNASTGYSGKSFFRI